MNVARSTITSKKISLGKSSNTLSGNMKYNLELLNNDDGDDDDHDDDSDDDDDNDYDRHVRQ